MRLWSWRHRISVAAVALFGAWYFGTPLLLGPIVKADPVIRADFVVSVVASGHVEASFRVNIGSQVTGIVVEVPVTEGQSVKAGDTLIVLDSREARSAAVEAESLLAQTQAKLRQQREVAAPTAADLLKQAQATLLGAQLSYDRAAKLAVHGYGSTAILDEATKALEIARAQVRNAQLQVFTNSPGGSDYVMVETQLNQARANAATAQARLSYTLIKAPRDGILISRDVEAGNVVQPSNVLMKLSPTSDTQLVVQIDEKNLGLVSIGQKALASADAYPKNSFPAEVAYINPGIDLQRASVEMKLRVPDPPPYLRQDMTVSVDIETATRPRTLVVPAADIRSLPTGKPWVLKVEQGRARRQAVKTGLVSTGQVEVLDGLKEGDLVVPATAAAVKDGTRVRARVAAEPTP